MTDETCDDVFEGAPTVEELTQWGNDFDYIRDVFTRDGLEIKVKRVCRSPYSWLTLVLPEGPVGNNAAVARMRRSLSGDTTVRGLYASLPQTPYVGIETTRPGADGSAIGEICERARWKNAANGDNGLPLPVGVDVMGDDMIIDLSHMSHLFIFGGDTMAQGELVRPMLKALLDCRDSSQLELYAVDGAAGQFNGICSNVRNRIPHGEDNPHVGDEEALRWCRDVKQGLEAFVAAKGAREELLKREFCDSIEEYDAGHRNKLSRSVFFLSDIPRMETEGDSQASKAISEVEDLIADLVCEDIQRLGFHFVWVQFDLSDISGLQNPVQSVIRGRGSDVRSGCIVHNSMFDEADLLMNFGGMEPYGKLHGSCFYANPNNEVTRIYLAEA